MDQANYKALQFAVFERLKYIYKGNDLVSELGALLDLQKAAVYKRMSGDTMIKFNELVEIAVHFNFSLESIFNASKKHVSFQYDLLDRDIETYMDVLEYIKDVFDSFRNLPDNKLIYSSRHLPFMHYLRYPEIFEIHMHVWNKTSFFNDHLRYKESNIKRLSASEIEVMKYLNEEYERHPMLEIWGTNILEDLYRKIKFLVLSNVITEQIYLDTVLTNIKLMINRLKEITQSGTKPHKEGEPLVSNKVYINELDLGTPMLYYRSREETKVFLIHQEPNFVYTYNRSFCQYSKDLLQNIIDHSTVISGEGTRERIKYFKKVEDTYEQFRIRIQKVFEYANI